MAYPNDFMAVQNLNFYGKIWHTKMIFTSPQNLSILWCYFAYLNEIKLAQKFNFYSMIQHIHMIVYNSTKL